MTSIEKISIYGSSSIGVFIFTSENYSLVPPDIDLRKVKIIEDTLKTITISTTIMNSRLLGVFVAGNSSGLLLPRLISDREFNTLKRILSKNDIKLSRIESKATTLGNLILVNDYKAIVSPYLSEKEFLDTIRDTLDVEVIVKKIGGSPLVGTMASVTNRGGLVNPMVPDIEIDYLRDFFKINMNVGTVNRGYPYIRAGIIANSKGALIGSDTTGPEIMRIMTTLFS